MEDSDGILGSEHAERVVQDSLDQRCEKRAVLQDALKTHDEPEPNANGMGLDPELYCVAGPGASAEIENDNGCLGDETRSGKVSEIIIGKAKGSTLEDILIDRLVARINKLYGDEAM